MICIKQFQFLPVQKPPEPLLNDGRIGLPVGIHPQLEISGFATENQCVCNVTTRQIPVAVYAKNISK